MVQSSFSAHLSCVGSSHADVYRGWDNPPPGGTVRGLIGGLGRRPWSPCCLRGPTRSAALGNLNPRTRENRRYAVRGSVESTSRAPWEQTRGCPS